MHKPFMILLFLLLAMPSFAQETEEPSGDEASNISLLDDDYIYSEPEDEETLLGSKVEERILRSAVEEGIRTKRSEIKACLVNALRSTQKLSGRLELTIRINEEGAVSSTEVKSDGLGSPELSHCIQRRIREITFTKPEGGPVKITYPFVFEAGS